MNNGYENAPATKMLATSCAICGRPLIDALSVERNIGPECYGRIDADLINISDDKRKTANVLLHDAAEAAHDGRVYEVQVLASKIRELGLVNVANLVLHRFDKVAAKAEIIIEERDGKYIVETPYRRKDSDAFVNAWRNVPGRRWADGKNVVPVASKKELWSLLQRFFGGRYAMGPKGSFCIPKIKPVVVQQELKIV